MRLVFLLAAALVLAGSMTAGEQQSPVSEGTVDLAAVEAVIDTAGQQLTALDAVIFEQEEKLDTLYLQRDAAREAGDSDQTRRFDQIIDQMNLTLTNLETERDRIAAMIGALRDQLSVLRDAASAESGDEP